MKTIRVSLKDSHKFSEPIAACIGFFDGFHLGHQQLINETLQYAKENGVSSAIFSFDKDPGDVINDSPSRHIMTLTDKINYLNDKHFDYFIVMEFTLEMMRLSIDEFHRMVLDKFDIRQLFVGKDFHYAYKGEGSFETLGRDYKVKAIDLMNYEGEKISSTRIKKELDNGNIKQVNNLLGRPFQVTAKVIHGHQLGKTIGFPTANLEMSPYLCYPKEAVYVGSCTILNKDYLCMINIGKPSVSVNESATFEVHVIGYDGNLYDSYLTIRFIDLVREEMKFNSLEELKTQLQRDITYINENYQ
ncbi:MAG: riboflavin biosynthesis protein RibF [Erysipelotrichaceae bacterium]|nr:riboflavin biosynthesis protein RibF [Erysipelotrichaceae bacterium]